MNNRILQVFSLCVSLLILLSTSCTKITEDTALFDVQTRLDNGEPLEDILTYNHPDRLTGAKYQGGLIYKIDVTKRICLIASEYNIGEAAWGGPSSDTLEHSYNGLGEGVFATEYLVLNDTTTGTAAKLCWQHVNEGYDDWFLPNLNEIEALENSLFTLDLGNIGLYDIFWSSTIRPAKGPMNFSIFFNENNGPPVVKHLVRPIRRVDY